MLVKLGANYEESLGMPMIQHGAYIKCHELCYFPLSFFHRDRKGSIESFRPLFINKHIVKGRAF